jgi:hypothetical protein
MRDEYSETSEPLLTTHYSPLGLPESAEAAEKTVNVCSVKFAEPAESSGRAK